MRSQRVTIDSRRYTINLMYVHCESKKLDHFFHLSITFANTVRFLPRDTMHKRGLCRHAVSACVSVCLSVT